MTRTILFLILANVFITSFAQILLKAGMNSGPIQASLHGGSSFNIALNIATNYLVVLGIACYVGATVIWLFVLAKVDVSLAYPFVGLSFVITMVMAWVVHDEVLSLARIAGTLLIVCGVYVLARSSV